jgi:orotidine-5'-phosphate decarboxylase
MSQHVADRLTAAVRAKKTPLCVGLDPRYDQLPQTVRQKHPDTRAGQGQAYAEFCCRVIDIVSPLVAVVKPQSAFFEALGPDGMIALAQVMRHARQKGLFTILDAKRNDIATTAAAYAEMAFQVYDADMLTVSPYLGKDSIEPFLQLGRKLHRGVFILVRTSNPGAGMFQDLKIGGQALHQHVAKAVVAWAMEHMNFRGNFGDVGAVVGATSREELASLRQLLPGIWLLVPGFGIQGATAADTAPGLYENGLGAVINSSRAILFSVPPSDPKWEEAVERATQKAIQELAVQTPAGNLRQQA